MDCDEECDVILEEYKNPLGRGLEVWMGAGEILDEYNEEGAVRCPKCQGMRLILGPASHEDAAVAPCPRCAEGTLVGGMVWIS